MSSVIITMIATLVIVAPITWLVSSSVQKKIHNTTIGNANDKAREIIDEALKTAETKKKESLLEIKEESLKTRNELEKETKERRAEIQRYERRVLSKEAGTRKNLRTYLRTGKRISIKDC